MSPTRYRVVRYYEHEDFPISPSPTTAAINVKVEAKEARLPVIGRSGDRDIVQWPDGRREVLY